MSSTDTTATPIESAAQRCYADAAMGGSSNHEPRSCSPWTPSGTPGRSEAARRDRIGAPSALVSGRGAAIPTGVGEKPTGGSVSASPFARRLPARPGILSLFLGATAIVFGVSCGANPPRPATPCMSDSECRADRICHDGRCRFLDDVRAELDADRDAQTALLDASVPDADRDGGDQSVGMPSISGQDQPTFMGNARHTGQSPRRGPAAEPAIQWTHRARARVFASPVIGVDGTVYVGALDNTFMALRPDGSLRFRYAARDKIYSTAAVAVDGTIYIGCNDRTVIALTPLGQVRFRTELGDVVDSSPTIGDDGTIYVAADGVYALEPVGGNIRWHVVAAGHVRSAPALHPRGFLVVGTAAGSVMAISLRGRVLWETPAGASVDGSAAIGADGTIYVGNDLGHVLALDPDGQQRWRFETQGDVRATPAIRPDGTIVVGSYDRHIYGISATGEQLFRTETAGRIRSSARIDADGRIYVGSQDDFLYALGSDGQILWRVNLGQDVDSTVAFGDDGTVYVGADDGGIYALR